MWKQARCGGRPDSRKSVPDDGEARMFVQSDRHRVDRAPLPAPPEMDPAPTAGEPPPGHQRGIVPDQRIPVQKPGSLPGGRIGRR